MVPFAVPRSPDARHFTISDFDVTGVRSAIRGYN